MQKNSTLIKGALLHDIGKIVMRADRSLGNHSDAGVNFLKQYIDSSDDNKKILECIKYHHSYNLKNAKLSDDSIAYIVYEADNISAGIDRRDNDGNEKGFDLYAPLESVFNIFSGDDLEKAKIKYSLRGLNGEDKFNYPTSENIKASADKYQNLVDVLNVNFTKTDLSNMSENEILRIIEDIFSYVPSSTNKGEVCDISLYIHSKITAAIADCMMKYFTANKITNYKKACYSKNQEFRNTEMFLLVSGDISGIQDFIYNIPTKGALKSLRGRSFYLELLIENFIDELLEEIGLSRANLLYSGGGHFYILAPATLEVQEIINHIHEKCNNWLLNKFSTKLYLAIGYTACSANELMESSKQRSIFASVSQKINADKLKRYSKTQLSMLFDEEDKFNKVKEESRECSICHTSTKDLISYQDNESLLVCDYCNGLFKLGEKVLQEEIVFIVSDEVSENALEIFSPNVNKYLYTVKINDIEKFNKNIIRIYSKNKSLTGKYISTRLWISEYTYRDDSGKILTFEELAENSCDEERGIKRLGVLRADVDNLGAAFMAGFVNNNLSDPLRYSTFARYADLSRDMSMFFKLAVDKICKGELNGYVDEKLSAFNLFELNKKTARKVHVVYSGGDDMFLVGAWDDLIETAIDIRNALKKYTNNKLSFSAGLAMFTPSYPIGKMAEITGVLEAKAKDNDGKDSIALFGIDTEIRVDDQKLTGECRHVYKWDELINAVHGEKLRYLLSYLDVAGDNSNKIKAGKTFIYKLLQLIEQMDKDEINIARFAYTLARLQPANKNDTDLNKLYEKFSNQMYKWIKDKRERSQLYTALTLLVYYLREGRNE